MLNPELKHHENALDQEPTEDLDILEMMRNWASLRQGSGNEKPRRRSIQKPRSSNTAPQARRADPGLPIGASLNGAVGEKDAKWFGGLFD
jgi:hypothetical protein